VDKFLDCVNRGEFLVPSPFNPKQVARVKIKPIRVSKNLLGAAEIAGNCEGFVFWTKNPAPLLPHLPKLRENYECYFQFTLNAYPKAFEANLPLLDDRTKTFQAVSKICPVIWRYDPIFLSKEITVEWHIKQFEHIAERLAGCTNTCMINTLIGRYNGIWAPTVEQTRDMAKAFVEIGAKYGIKIQTCAEIINLAELGITHGKCLDPEIFEKLLSKKFEITAKFNPKKANGATRKGCHCCQSIDIGTYGTCAHGCSYCYAKSSRGNCENPQIYDRKVERVFEFNEALNSPSPTSALNVL
jgi:hypothetical protein